jgi:hypothetical protein
LQAPEQCRSQENPGKDFAYNFWLAKLSEQVSK